MNREGFERKVSQPILRRRSDSHLYGDKPWVDSVPNQDWNRVPLKCQPAGTILLFCVIFTVQRAWFEFHTMTDVQSIRYITVPSHLTSVLEIDNLVTRKHQIILLKLNMNLRFI